MKKLLRTLRINASGREHGFWLAGQFRGEKHPMADDAIAAWSEFMGRESAELWIAANAARQASATARHAPPRSIVQGT
ncbi:MAG: hypothetical protein ACK6DM_15165 [Alphaproteobacteria bacterium]|jgi:hypothetical protein